MVKRTLHFGNPAHLSLRHNQLQVELKDEHRTSKSIPIEDLGVVVIEHPQVTLTSGLLDALMQNKTAVITCSGSYMPSGMLLPFEGHSEQTERMQEQLDASVPLKKQLWQQTVKAKIENQAAVLAHLGLNFERLSVLREQVLSGDTGNAEGQAAQYYWDQLYGRGFVRSRQRESPNAQLNYGYAILRSLVARALVSSGLLPSQGIFHRNKYNAFCLADDIMEPYRPYVDWEVLHLSDLDLGELTREQKIHLLQIPTLDVQIGEVSRPLFHAVSISTASLSKCFGGDQRKLLYPEFKRDAKLPF